MNTIKSELLLFTGFVLILTWAKLYRKKFIINNNLYFNSLKIGEDITYSLTSYMKTDTWIRTMTKYSAAPTV